MLQKTLFATTALVLCVSLSFAGPKDSQDDNRNLLRNQKPGIPIRLARPLPVIAVKSKPGAAPVRNNISHWVPGATFNNFSKDKNAEYLSWYGFRVADYSYPSSSGCNLQGFSGTASNAIPITGTGAKVTKIKLPLFSFTDRGQAVFNVGIYSATASGLPGSTELAGGSTTASDTDLCCTAVRAVKVDITLQAGQKYFVEVKCANENCEGGWYTEDTDLSGKTQDYFRFVDRWHCVTGGHTRSTIVSSPWHLSSYYPEQAAAIVK